MAHARADSACVEHHIAASSTTAPSLVNHQQNSATEHCLESSNKEGHILVANPQVDRVSAAQSGLANPVPPRTPLQMDESSGNGTNFSNLPREIRDMIYGHAFPKDIKSPFQLCSKPVYPHHERNARAALNLLINLRQTSRQVCDKASEAFGDRYRFGVRVHLRAGYSKLPSPGVQILLSRSPMPYVRHVRLGMFRNFHNSLGVDIELDFNPTHNACTVACTYVARPAFWLQNTQDGHSTPLDSTVEEMESVVATALSNQEQGNGLTPQTIEAALKLMYRRHNEILPSIRRAVPGARMSRAH